MSERIFLTEGTQNRFATIVQSDVAFSEEIPAQSRRSIARCLALPREDVDSVMYVTTSTVGHFGMRVLERDNSESTMCGNGIRASALLFSKLLAKKPKELFIETRAGLQQVIVDSPNNIAVRMTRFSERGSIKLDDDVAVHLGDVGEPHAVIFTQRGEMEDLISRHGPIMTSGSATEGTSYNLNCVEVLSDNEISIRTFERGVEAVTASCGTGATVAAHIARRRFGLDRIIHVRSRGGTLTIDTQEGIMTGPALVRREITEDIRTMLCPDTL